MSTTETCVWCKGKQSTVGAELVYAGAIEWRRSRTATGFKISAWCLNCGIPARPGHFAAHSRFTDAEVARMPWIDGPELKAACQVCHRVAVLECHHLAPRAQFGAESDLWPTVHVCRPCHARWHALMGQPIGIAEAAE